MIDLEKPPPGSRIGIDQRPDCTVISLKAAAIAKLLPDSPFVFVAMGAGLALLLLVIVGIAKDTNAAGLLCPLGCLIIGVFFSLGPAIRLYHRSRGAVFEISRDRLTVAAPGFVFFQRLRWRRDRLGAVAAWKGLQIAETSGTITTLCPYHPLEELACIAVLMRQLLGLPEELPCRAGELSVRYTGTFWDDPIAGVLSVEPGRMSLRHPLDPRPYLYFRSASTPRWPGQSSIPLSESDFNCRVLEHGMMCLRIAPRDVRCRFDQGRPEIQVGLLGRLLTESRITLDGETTPKRYLPEKEADFEITIWCHDNEALPRALGRFWGSEELPRG
jgi:hypothetical protein